MLEAADLRRYEYCLVETVIGYRDSKEEKEWSGTAAVIAAEARSPIWDWMLTIASSHSFWPGTCVHTSQNAMLHSALLPASQKQNIMVWRRRKMAYKVGGGVEDAFDIVGNADDRSGHLRLHRRVLGASRDRLENAEQCRRGLGGA